MAFDAIVESRSQTPLGPRKPASVPKSMQRHAVVGRGAEQESSNRVELGEGDDGRIAPSLS